MKWAYPIENSIVNTRLLGASRSENTQQQSNKKGDALIENLPEQRHCTGEFNVHSLTYIGKVFH